MSKVFSVPVKRKTGEILTDVELKELITRLPEPFEFMVGDAVFAAQPNPNRVTGAHNNRIQAVFDKIRMLTGMGEEEVKNLTREQLLTKRASARELDIASLEEAYNELDRAQTQRAVDGIDRSDNDWASWNYPEPLTVELLLKNAPLGESFVRAFNLWWQDFTSGSRATGTTQTAYSATLTTNTTNPPAEAAEAAK